MKYKVVKLAFSQGVHLGNGMLTDGGNTVFADTLFSALCQEALQMEGSVEGLCDLVRRNQLRFSDGMPYIGEKLYIPKPYLSVKTEEEGDSSLKKAFKKLTYIPVEKVEQYLSGKLDAAAENTVLSGLGSYEMRNHAAINRGKDSDPYHVGVYHFNPGCGLYLVIGYETEEIWSYAEQLLTALSYTGIGGRRSSGLGRFTLETAACPKALADRLTGKGYTEYMTLSIALPDQQELEQACEDSRFNLVKRSGFVASVTYAEEHLKKRDFYGMAAGSTFRNLFKGNLYDVSFKGRHPVYRYGYPLFVGIR